VFTTELMHIVIMSTCCRINTWLRTKIGMGCCSKGDEPSVL